MDDWLSVCVIKLARLAGRSEYLIVLKSQQSAEKWVDFLLDWPLDRFVNCLCNQENLCVIYLCGCRVDYHKPFLCH